MQKQRHSLETLLQRQAMVWRSSRIQWAGGSAAEQGGTAAGAVPQPAVRDP